MADETTTTAATDAAIEKAAELNLDLEAIEGTGAEGRITAPDVERAAKEKAPAEKEVYVFNKKTGLVGYTFGDGRKFKTGVRYALTAEEVEAYAHKRPSAAGGHQVLVKE